MKKFKTSAKQQDFQDENLHAILGEKNLIYNALVRYTHLPLGLFTAALMLLTSWLVDRPLLSWENALLIYQGIGGIALFYMLQGLMAFTHHKALLQHVRNAFVGSKVYPALFAGLLLYMALPLGWPVLGATLCLFALLLLYHLRVQRRPLWQHKPLGSLIFTAYITLLIWLAVLAPGGKPSVPALGVTLLSAVLFGVLSLGFRHLLHLEKVDFVEKRLQEL
ncbi:MAG: hypothetical protein IGS03_04410 [Candidatus Sericytochromatia bacterium]|nr:hypothetical protein [Candidatus Sericytochromatia bacterium]